MITITAIASSQSGRHAAQEVCHPVEMKALRFPGGEIQVTVANGVAADALQIHAHVPDANAIMTLLMATDALRRAYPGIPIDLHLPYVPYARQDRVANPGEALSVKVCCELLNAQHYRSVVIQDPHSDVTPALLDRVVIEDPLPSLRRVLEHVHTHHLLQEGLASPLALIAPDAGARKRVFKLAAQLGLPVVFADKLRDTRTGAITGTTIQGDLPDCPLLVVDDICDGGRTFTELAQALREKLREKRAHSAAQEPHLNPLYLFVTHGIFSKGLDILLTHYVAIFTRNNWTDDARATLV